MKWQTLAKWVACCVVGIGSMVQAQPPTPPTRPPTAPGSPPSTPPAGAPTAPSQRPSTPPGQGPATPPPRAPGPATPPMARPGNPAVATPTNPAARPPAANPAARPPAPGARPAPAANAREEDDKLKPQVLTLTTRDGVKLRCVYFPSDRGKKAIPVIVVHELGGQSAPYVTPGNDRVAPLAVQLQNAGFAVICPDLRGHGGSLTQAGNPKELDRTRFSKRDVMAIIQGDMETVKGFLREENDADRLNMNALIVIGVQESCVIAMNWAAADWEWPTIPGKKQGQDVKSLVLISPVKLFEGVSYEPILKHPIISRLPTLIIAGKDSPQAEEAERLEKLLGKVRTGSAGTGAGMLQVQVVPSSASGARLLGMEATSKLIIAFLMQNISEKLDQFQWVKRSK